MLARVERYFSNLEGWRRAAVACLLGALTVLALAPVFAWPVLFITIPALSWLMHEPCSPAKTKPATRTLGQHVRRTAAAGWCFGFGYFLAGLHWIGEPFLVEAETFAWLMPFAIVLMPSGLALFFGLAGGIAGALWSPGWRSTFALAAGFGLAEWLRGTVLTGFPWNALGYALTANETMLQFSAVLGIYGLSALVPFVFGIPLLLAKDAIAGRTPRSRWIAIAVVYMMVATGIITWGLYRQALTFADVPGVRLRLVQPAIPQTEKWAPEHRNRNFAKLIDLSLRNEKGRVDDLAGTTHVIWPESAIPFLLLRTPGALQRIAREFPTGTTLMTGALRLEEASAGKKRRIFNSLLMFDSDARLIATYDKIHLVPFGEYLPLRWLLERLGFEQLTRQRGGFTVGDKERLISRPGIPPFTPLVCYEVIFPGAAVTTEQRPDWMLVVTNDAWFGSGAGPRQHFHHARVRAVEEGLPLVRVSNNGISAIVDATGRVRKFLALNQAGTLDGRLPVAAPPTPYAKWRNLPFWTIVLICLLAAIANGIRGRRPSEGAQP